jgi:hypothetical protein
MSVSGSAKQRGIFIRIALPDGVTVMRLWLGFGDIDVPTNSLDVDGERYQGLGAIVGIPALDQAINGKSTRADFTLSGVSANVAGLADADADTIQGANVNVGVCKFDGDWQIDGDVSFLWDGLADVLATGMSADPDGRVTYTIRMSVGTAPAGRSRAEFANWTDAQHQISHPGDPFFNQAPPPEATERWPGG